MDKFREFKTALGPGARVLNAYSLKTTEAVYKGQRKATNDKRVFILTRSVFAGQQRNAVEIDISRAGDRTQRRRARRRSAERCQAGIQRLTTGHRVVADVGRYDVGREFDEATARLVVHGRSHS